VCRPPYVSEPSLLRSDSLRLLKLHGSLDTYWVRGDVSGSQIIRLPAPSTGIPHRDPTLAEIATHLDASRFLSRPRRQSPPSTTTRSHDSCGAMPPKLSTSPTEWRSSGYSLPVTDLVTAGMNLRRSLRTRGTVGAGAKI